MAADEGAKAVRRRRPWVFAVLLTAIGAALAISGARLVSLDGSPYYLAAGVATAASGLLLWLRRGWGSLLYAAMLLATLAWALWEAGPDGWALAPRLIGPSVLGLWLLAPWTVQGLDRPILGDWRPSPRIGGYAALAVLAAFASICLANALKPIVVSPASPPAAAASPDAGAAIDWPHYGGDLAGTRFSRLDQITPANVGRLELAWTFRTGPTPPGLGRTFETTPLKIGETLYLCDGANKIFALDAETGAKRWVFDSRPRLKGVAAGTCRGVAYFRAPSLAADAPCAGRVLATTIDGRLLAIDARTGRLCEGFGQAGAVDLSAALKPYMDGRYELTSAPTVVRGKVVVGGWISDNEMIGEPSGVVRAFDALTGAFAWAWDIGRPTEHGPPPPGQTFTRGTPNVWAPTTADEKLGLVFLPTGNATPDYWGAHRSPQSEKYSSSVVAVDAETGAPRWSFQTVHHDVWDYDVNSQPTLADVDLGKGAVPVVIQATKRGEVFVLDRRTGQPLTRVDERPVPQGPAPGDWLAPTQPFSTGMPSFGGPDLAERDMWGLTPFDQMWCRIRYREARHDGTMTPPGVRPSVKTPGYKGGVGWGGVSVDLDRQIMVVNSSRIANYVRLVPRKEADVLGVKPRGMGGRRSPIQAQAGAPFAVDPRPFLSPLGAPCQEPPYGMLSAVDLKTQKLLWTQRLGTAEDSGPLGLESRLPFLMGVPNDGGVVTTRSGLTFIGATQERALRAFETRTGRLLWKVRVPAGPQATPMTYVSGASGRQFVVLAAGGHPSMRTKPGDYILAYALPAPASAGE